MSDAMMNGFASSARNEQHRRALSKLERELGSAIRACLADSGVIEIMLNPDGRLWVERIGHDMKPIGVMTASDAERLISTIAGNLGKIITYEKPGGPFTATIRRLPFPAPSLKFLNSSGKKQRYDYLALNNHSIVFYCRHVCNILSTYRGSRWIYW